MFNDNLTMDLLEAAFNILCHNSPQHYNCMSDQCDGCDWDALQLVISKHINDGETHSGNSLPNHSDQGPASAGPSESRC